MRILATRCQRLTCSTGSRRFSTLLKPKVKQISGLRAFEPERALQMARFRKLNAKGEPVLKVLT